MIATYRANVESMSEIPGRPDFMDLVFKYAHNFPFHKAIVNPTSGKITIDGKIVTHTGQLVDYLDNNRNVLATFDYDGDKDGSGNPLDTLEEIAFTIVLDD